MTILKLGFAMGGGVSLGTFNAGALAQSIKLAILYGKDKKGRLFDEVEIDVFSGASAGAISLALMVRALASQSPKQIDAASKSLKKEFGADFAALSAHKKQSIIAAQVMSDVQRDIWVNKVTMHKLLSSSSNNPADPDSLKFSAGILNRAALEEIAIDLIKGSPTDNLNESKRLLGKRVLFANSLSNLTPTIQDARGEFSVKKGGSYALGDGMTSYTHKESRIFDLYFDEAPIDGFTDTPNHPNRWMRYHLGAQQKNAIGDMREGNNELWWRMISTAMASGAFPMAFEPVVLTRYQYEFGNTWPKELKRRRSFDFTYIDGGVYNNEPIRDAFRLASFIDANDEREDTERAIIFVDPSVTDNATEFYVPVQQRFKLSAPLFGDNWLGDIDGVDLVAKSSLSRLSSHVQTIISGIFNQARSLEGDKIFQVRKRFEQRNEIRAAYAKDTELKATRGLLLALYQQLESTQKSDSSNDLLPSTGLSILSEAKRILREEPVRFAGMQKDELQSDLTKIAQQKATKGSLNDWYLMLRFMLLDQSMRLNGKSDHVRFFAIGPFANPSASSFKDAAKLDLPSDKIMGFGGFMYRGARQIDMEAGAYCAHQALTTTNFLKVKKRQDAPSRLTLGQEKYYKKALNKGVDALSDRVLDMLTDAWLPKFTRGIVKFFINRALNSDGLPSAIELRIKLPDDLKLELDGRGQLPIVGDKDIKRIKLNDGYYLITFANVDSDNQWKGEHVSRKQTIQLDKSDRKYALIPLPDPQIVEKMKMFGYAYLAYDFSEKRTDKSWAVETSMVPMHEVLIHKAK